MRLSAWANARVTWAREGREGLQNALFAALEVDATPCMSYRFTIVLTHFQHPGMLMRGLVSGTGTADSRSSLFGRAGW